jgi:hypothetical protein
MMGLVIFSKRLFTNVSAIHQAAGTYSVEVNTKDLNSSREMNSLY